MAKTFVISKWTAEVTDDGADKVLLTTPPEGMPHEFRLLDGDGVVYAYGYSKTNDDENAFNPLDCYTDDYGVVSIEYYNPNTNEWEEL